MDQIRYDTTVFGLKLVHPSCVSNNFIGENLVMITLDFFNKW